MRPEVYFCLGSPRCVQGLCVHPAQVAAELGLQPLRDCSVFVFFKSASADSSRRPTLPHPLVAI